MTSWKQYQKLKFKKYRQEWKLFLVEGKRLCQEAINSHWTIESAFIQESFQNDPSFPNFEKIISGKNIHLQILSPANFDKLADTKNPQGILLVMKMRQSTDLLAESWRDQSIILLLDGIRDPGNFGTIIRTADWFGVNFIASSADAVDFYNSKTIRASMGSMFRVNYLEVENLVDFIKILKNNQFTILATSPRSAKTMEQLPITFPVALLLGGEAEGISSALLKLSSDIIQIRKYGQADSLNVAVAAGILLNRFTSYKNK
jgi:TrmH family RNA methyltransferase